MTDNILPFKIPEPDDFLYVMDEDGEMLGVAGENIYMEFTEDGDGFYFNGDYIKREELIAFILISGLWQDVQDKP